MRCNQLIRRFTKRSESLLAAADLLESVLIYLRFEGTVARKRNLQRVSGLLSRLQVELTKRFVRGRQDVFPYLKRHIPRLEGALDLLYREQAEAVQRMKSFERKTLGLQKLERAGRQRKVLGVYREGVYLAYMVRHCLKAEVDLIRESIQILRETERQQLGRLLACA